MKKPNYPIDPDYKKYSKVNPPLNRFILPFIRLFGRLCIKLQKSNKDLKAVKYKIPVNKGKIKATIFTPKAVKSSSMLIFYHGGGFCYPAAPYHFSLAKKLAIGANCSVAVISYRLAPKHKFPTQNEDCYKAYCFFREKAQSLGIDENKIIVGGDSAGGNLAVGVCLMAKSKGESLPLAQMLLYPALSFDQSLESMKSFPYAPMCSLNDIKKYQKLYLKATCQNNEYLSPTMANLEGFPPTYIETARFDVLNSGATAFADKLNAYNIPTEVVHTKGTIHAFDIVPNAKTTLECIDKRIDFLIRQFNNLN